MSLPGPSKTFKGLTGNSICLIGPSRTFQVLPEPSKAFQESSRTFKILTRVFQGFLGPTGAFQDIQGPSKSLPGPSRAIKKSSRAFQDLPTRSSFLLQISELKWARIGGQFGRPLGQWSTIFENLAFSKFQKGLVQTDIRTHKLDPSYTWVR